MEIKEVPLTQANKGSEEHIFSGTVTQHTAHLTWETREDYMYKPGKH